MKRRSFLLAILPLFLFLAPFARAAPETRAVQEDNIREAVFRHQFGNNASGQKQGAKVYFLSLGWKTDPSDEFMARFAGNTPPVKKVSEADSSAMKGVHDKKTGESGLIFNVGKITWKSDTEATANGGYYKAGLSASGNTYTLEKKDGVWTVTKDVMNWIS